MNITSDVNIVLVLKYLTMRPPRPPGARFARAGRQILIFCEYVSDFSAFNARNCVNWPE